jgi:NADPH:quinone reductase-like Zn-dependent oxidoreductase
MKAVVYTRYGPPDVLRLTDLDTPVPERDQVLVKVHAVSVNASGWEVLRGKPLYSRIGGPFRPRHHILGSDIAGHVVSTGPAATQLRPGDDVFADILDFMGGFAEYVCVPQKKLAPIPAGLTYEQAAALPQVGAIAWQGIRDKGQVPPGQKVLINGGGGGSGMYAIQLAKLPGGRGHRGGQRGEAGVHALAGRRPGHRLRAGGLHQERAPLRPDPRPGRLPARRRLPALAAARGALPVRRRVGRDAPAGPADRAADRTSRAQDTGAGGPARCPAPRPIVELIQAGTITTVIDRRFPLDQVPQALRHVGEGHATGKVIITVT